MNKKFWFINTLIVVDSIKVIDAPKKNLKRMKEIDNYFETRAEARLAQKKIIKTLKGGKK